MAKREQHGNREAKKLKKKKPKTIAAAPSVKGLTELDVSRPRKKY
jgi:hypothetical protein